MIVTKLFRRHFRRSNVPGLFYVCFIVYSLKVANVLKESRVTIDKIHVKNAGMVSSVRSFVSEETRFDNIWYYSKCTCVRCEISQNFYIVSLDMEEQSKKNGAILNFMTKKRKFHANLHTRHSFQSIIIPNARKFPKTSYSQNVYCFIFVVFGWTTIRNENIHI